MVRTKKFIAGVEIVACLIRVWNKIQPGDAYLRERLQMKSAMQLLTVTNLDGNLSGHLVPIKEKMS